jgi:CheY-like chemotaxis protein
VEVLGSARAAAGRIDAGARWDVILCDLLMPEMSGMELSSRVEATASDLARRMIFMTGGAYTDEARRFLEVEGHRWIEKPIDPATLRAVVREVAGDPVPTVAR